jgi:hypothetical protein
VLALLLRGCVADVPGSGDGDDDGDGDVNYDGDDVVLALLLRERATDVLARPQRNINCCT